MKLYPWIIGTGFLLILSCGNKPQSIWQEPMIAVISEQNDWDQLEPVLEQVYEKVIRTPQTETVYVLKHAPDSLFDYYSKQRYLILTGTLQSRGPVGDLIQRITADPGIRQSIEQGKNFVFTRRDEWAYDQTMIILIGSHIESLKQKIEDHQAFLYDLMDSEVKQSMQKEVLKNRINKELTDELLDKYQFNMQMQKDYFLAQDFPDKNFLWMHRRFPDRWIFVRWIDDGDPDLIDKAWVVEERNRIGKTFYTDYQEQVVQNPRYLHQENGEFLGRQAIITQGLWERIDDTAGGPFRNYTFYDSGTERIYMIDVAVFAPGKEKLPYLRRVDIIAETFRTLFDKPFEL